MIDSLDSWAAPEDEKSRDPWRKLDCPLVVAIQDRTKIPLSTEIHKPRPNHNAY
jgi:hypothetical protein